MFGKSTELQHITLINVLAEWQSCENKIKHIFLFSRKAKLLVRKLKKVKQACSQYIQVSRKSTRCCHKVKKTKRRQAEFLRYI